MESAQNSDPDEEDLESEAESGSDDFDSEGEDDSFDDGVKERILQFLQEASLDELTLISGCSLKKAQKILLLRPFNTWKDVVRNCCSLISPVFIFKSLDLIKIYTL